MKNNTPKRLRVDLKTHIGHARSSRSTPSTPYYECYGNKDGMGLSRTPSGGQTQDKLLYDLVRDNSSITT